jgi:hypothetical protein
MTDIEHNCLVQFNKTGLGLDADPVCSYRLDADSVQNQTGSAEA